MSLKDDIGSSEGILGDKVITVDIPRAITVTVPSHTHLGHHIWSDYHWFALLEGQTTIRSGHQRLLAANPRLSRLDYPPPPKQIIDPFCINSALRRKVFKCFLVVLLQQQLWRMHFHKKGRQKNRLGNPPPPNCNRTCNSKCNGKRAGNCGAAGAGTTVWGRGARPRNQAKGRLIKYIYRSFRSSRECDPSVKATLLFQNHHGRKVPRMGTSRRRRTFL
jgi:hypothetical protein